MARVFTVGFRAESVDRGDPVKIVYVWGTTAYTEQEARAIVEEFNSLYEGIGLPEGSWAIMKGVGNE